MLCEKPWPERPGGGGDAGGGGAGRQAVDDRLCAPLRQRLLHRPGFPGHGYCGEIYYAKAVYQRRNGNPGGWFGDKSRSGGGPLIDLGVHVIDLVRFLMGNPQPVSAYGAAFHKLGNREGLKAARGYVSMEKTDHDICDVEDSVTALIRFDNGAVLSVETAFCLNMKGDRNGVELFGTREVCGWSRDLSCTATPTATSPTPPVRRAGPRLRGDVPKRDRPLRRLRDGGDSLPCAGGGWRHPDEDTGRGLPFGGNRPRGGAVASAALVFAGLLTGGGDRRVANAQDWPLFVWIWGIFPLNQDGKAILELSRPDCLSAKADKTCQQRRMKMRRLSCY